MFDIRVLRRPVIFLAVLLLAVAPTVQANEALDQGMNYFKTGKFAEAAAEFQSLVDGSPAYDYGYFMLGLSFLRMNKPNEAEENLLEAIELNGDKFEYHNGLATVYFQQKQYPKVISALKTAEPLASDPKYQYSLYSMRGQSYAGLGKWSDAIDDLEKARKINGQKAALLVTLGQSYYKLGHYDKAVPVFRQAVRAVPNDSGTMKLLGESLLNLGAEAKSDSQKASYYGEALQVGEACAKQSPGSFDTHNMVGRAALGAKNYGKAEQAFRKVLAQKSDYCYAMVNLGKTFIVQQRWADAESILKEAASCAPRMAVVHESLGFAVQKQKRLEEAIGHYEKSIAIKPSAAVDRAIETCRTNLEVEQHNTEVAQLEQEQRDAEARAQKEFEEAQAKVEEWEKKTERDD